MSQPLVNEKSGWGVLSVSGFSCGSCHKAIRKGGTVFMVSGDRPRQIGGGAGGGMTRVFIHKCCLFEAAQGTPMDRVEVLRQQLQEGKGLFGDGENCGFDES